jgi:peptide chain release factor subunit 3
MADSWEDAADAPPNAGGGSGGGGFVPRVEAPSFVPRASAPTFVPGQAFNYAPPPPPPRAGASAAHSQPPPPPSFAAAAAAAAASQQQQQQTSSSRSSTPEVPQQQAPSSQPPSSSSSPAPGGSAANGGGDADTTADQLAGLSVASGEQPDAPSAASPALPAAAAAAAAAPIVEDVAPVDEGRVMEAYKRLVAEDPRDHLNVVFIGHVDAGKSTLGGQILFLTGGVDKRTIEKYEREAKNKNRESWYMAYIMDTNEEERVKGITVEVGRAKFETEARRYTILDAPGHKNYVPNMIMGAAQVGRRSSGAAGSGWDTQHPH